MDAMICLKCRTREASTRPTAYGMCVVCAWVWAFSSTRWTSGNTPTAREKWAEKATSIPEGRE